MGRIHSQTLLFGFGAVGCALLFRAAEGAYGTDMRTVEGQRQA